jgi:hypothetical protein
VNDGTFTISRAAFYRAWREGRLSLETVTLPSRNTDPDAFEPDGDPRAASRWADDGGRA